jgi:dipeptidase D
MPQHTDAILEIFETINSIPRCSKNEQALAAWLMAWAAQRDLSYRCDAAGNLVIQVPAGPGAENAPLAVLQGHMDMVCEKTPESSHDFTRDPIRSHRSGDWLKAQGTTLGADNGIALALALHLVDDRELKRPALELLFTVDEESGLSGASRLDPDLIRGRILINIDSEDEGVFTIGCAGGEETQVSLDLERETMPGDLAAGFFRVGGLRGGHSGVDIAKRRANANGLLGRLLARALERFDVRLVSLAGGSAHNAIPRDAQALVAVPVSDFAALEALADATQALFRREYGPADPDIQVTFARSAASTQAPLTAAATTRVADLLLALPHGVAGMSLEVEGLVETSCNLAILATDGETLKITSSQRSSSESRLDEMTARVTAVARLAGGRVARLNRYPAWQPEPASRLLARCQSVYRRVAGREPVVEIIHAGLECGLIGAKAPGMEMISIGPTLRNPHSPDEALHIPSVGRVRDFLAALLQDLANQAVD